jgi:hypothetical protein
MEVLWLLMAHEKLELYGGCTIPMYKQHIAYGFARSIGDGLATKLVVIP